MPLKRKFRFQMEIEVESFDHDGSEIFRPLADRVKADLPDLVSMTATPDLIPYEIDVLDFQFEEIK